MFTALRARKEWAFFRALPRADRPLAWLWWLILVARGLLPAGFAVAMGVLVAAVQATTAPASGAPAGSTTALATLAGPLALAGTLFVLLQVLTPLHQAIGKNLGSRTAAWLYDELMASCAQPPGVAHLEDDALASDLAMARDFDLGISGPPLAISMDFIAIGLVEFLAGLVAALLLAAYAWWAPLLLGGAWLATHWLLRESAVWQDRNTSEVREAQRHADYGYRLAVDAPAAKELRVFGLADWTVARFVSHRRRLYDLRWAATRLRERPLAASLVLVLGANLVLFAALAQDALAGDLPLGELVTFASAAIATSMIAFGGLSWALDGAAAPVEATARLQPAMARAGALATPSAPPGEAARRVLSRSESGVGEIRFVDVHFSYPGQSQPVLAGVNLTIPAGSSLAIVGQNGAGKTTLAKLLCRLYDPQRGRIEVDGVDLRDLPIDAWRARLAAVFQDFIRFELSLRDNIAPLSLRDSIAPQSGAGSVAPLDDATLRAALADAGVAERLALDTVLARAYAGGTDLSGGQWQRVALARALCGVRAGAGLVLLDEPTAQLDVRGELEIFGRVLAATRDVTTILVSHRFSTVRQADRICVLEQGRVLELGDHDALMAQGGRYRTMFDLQAARFGEPEEGVDALD
jgi:ABC-type multidrug transport system fused ATPase/permease subunit